MSLLSSVGDWLRNAVDDIGPTVTGLPAHGTPPTSYSLSQSTDTATPNSSSLSYVGNFHPPGNNPSIAPLPGRPNFRFIDIPNSPPGKTNWGIMGGAPPVPMPTYQNPDAALPSSTLGIGLTPSGPRYKQYFFGPNGQHTERFLPPAAGSGDIQIPMPDAFGHLPEPVSLPVQYFKSPPQPTLKGRLI